MKFDPASIPGAWPMAGDFTLPDWDIIRDWEQANFEEPQLQEVYTVLADYWLELLRKQLGGNYHICKSGKFWLLTSQDSDSAQKAMGILDDTVTMILRECEGVASDEGYGPNVAIMFEDDDDYYDYIGQYFPDVEGEIAGSAGMMLDQGYAHIVTAQSDLSVCQPTLFHEITHMLVSHLPLPLWVNEGLATSVQRALSAHGSPLLDQELATEHHQFWNEHNIQQFWNGESFFSEVSRRSSAITWPKYWPASCAQCPATASLSLMPLGKMQAKLRPRHISAAAWAILPPYSWAMGRGA